jgi:DNA polymerase V
MIRRKQINLVYRITRRRRRLFRPLFLSRVAAGFPSAAENYVEGRIDLNQELIRHPLTTFYVRVTGDSMIGAGIYPGSLLVVDRAENVKNGQIVVARIGDEFCVKRFFRESNETIWLHSENELYQPIEVNSESGEFEIWGRVTHAIQSF